MKALDALNVQIAKERLVPARERKDRHRRGHAHVHADHPAVDITRERPRRPAVAREDYRAVAVLRLRALAAIEQPSLALDHDGGGADVAVQPGFAGTGSQRNDLQMQILSDAIVVRGFAGGRLQFITA